MLDAKQLEMNEELSGGDKLNLRALLVVGAAIALLVKNGAFAFFRALQHVRFCTLPAKQMCYAVGRMCIMAVVRKMRDAAMKKLWTPRLDNVLAMFS